MTTSTVIMKVAIFLLTFASATASVTPMMRNEDLSVINPLPMDEQESSELTETEDVMASTEPMASPEFEGPMMQVTPRLSLSGFEDIPTESAEPSEPDASPEPETEFFPAVELNTNTGPTGSDACMVAFASCRVRFQGHATRPPVLRLDSSPDEAVSSRLVWHDDSRRLGTVNSETEGSILGGRGKWTLFSRYDTGRVQRFAHDQFKTFVIREGPYTGIGYKVFQGNVNAARGLCVRVRITSYQTLTADSRELDNVNNANECVVFQTRA